MIAAVVGGKGGVGKSTVALNLGRELDAVVVDADLATADLPRGTGPDLHDVLADRTAPTAAIERVGSVRVLPCGRTLAGARAAELTDLPRAIERVEHAHGRVVVDCPAGLARDVGTVLDAADVAVLVTTPDESALVDAIRTRRVVRALETPIAAGVLNRISAATEAGLTARLDRQLAAPVTTIAERDAVTNAQRQWRPVRDHTPDSPAVDAFETIARDVARCEQRCDRVTTDAP